MITFTSNLIKILCLSCLYLIPLSLLLAGDLVVKSPGGKIEFHVSVLENKRLAYTVLLDKAAVIEQSPIGLTVDNVDVCEAVSIGKTERYSIDETYPWRGMHAEAVNRCNGMKTEITHSKSKARFTLDVRVFDDGIAFRLILPGEKKRTVQNEPTRFILPEGSVAWRHNFRMHYEGKHTKSDVSEIPAGAWVAPPFTFKLPSNTGYASITEAELVNYSGMGLQAEGDGAFGIRLGHEQPVSYPYELRYDDAERLKTAAGIEAEIKTPWRVVMICENLNDLVNSDIVHNLSPAPDKKYFPEGFASEWLNPGRAVWGYLTDEPRTLQGMKNLSKLAGELGFEYHVVEGHWSRWPVEQQKELVDYSKKLGVKLLLWEHSKSLRDAGKRGEFFKHLHAIGAAGAKIDFFDHEAKEIIDLYYECLKGAAEYQLVLDFHGANKPTGESRTWPNEMTREAIKGMESRGPWAAHNTTLPFTRMLAGHADYTPLHFGARRVETTETHQIATAIFYQSSILIYAEHPKNLLAHKAVEIIKAIPATWDETIVLPGSEIGEVAGFARRKGNRWFLAVLNGESPGQFEVDLDFLDEGDYDAVFVRDLKNTSAPVVLTRTRRRFGDAAGVVVDRTTVNKQRGEGMFIEMLPAGGFVAMFTKDELEK